MQSASHAAVKVWGTEILSGSHVYSMRGVKNPIRYKSRFLFRGKFPSLKARSIFKMLAIKAQSVKTDTGANPVQWLTTIEYLVEK